MFRFHNTGDPQAERNVLGINELSSLSSPEMLIEKETELTRDRDSLSRDSEFRAGGTGMTGFMVLDEHALMLASCSRRRDREPNAGAYVLEGQGAIPDSSLRNSCAIFRRGDVAVLNHKGFQRVMKA